jgi:hypothetical protein
MVSEITPPKASWVFDLQIDGRFVGTNPQAKISIPRRLFEVSYRKRKGSILIKQGAPLGTITFTL